MIGVIAFSGRKRSGKTTIARAVSERLGWCYASFGDYVRTEALKRGLDVNRIETLQDLGETLIGQGWSEFCKNVLTESSWTQAQGLVVDGIRHVEALRQIQCLTAPLSFTLIYVSTAEDVIIRRLGCLNAAELSVIETHSTETDVIASLRDLADVTVDGSTPIQKSVDRILAYVETPF